MELQHRFEDTAGLKVGFLHRTVIADALIGQSSCSA